MRCLNTFKIMFDEIFKRWITTGQLTENDIVPLFLEWNQVFGDGKAQPEHVLGMLQILRTDYSALMNHILKFVGIKKGYHWEELLDRNGRVLTRFFINE